MDAQPEASTSNATASSSTAAPSSNTDSTTPAKRPRNPNKARACDQCHVRRIKCAGDGVPCIPCAKAVLDCTWEKPRLKKGPKGSTLVKLKEGSLAPATAAPPQNTQPHQSQPYHQQLASLSPPVVPTSTLAPSAPSISQSTLPSLNHHLSPTIHFDQQQAKYSQFSPDSPYTRLPAPNGPSPPAQSPFPPPPQHRNSPSSMSGLSQPMNFPSPPVAMSMPPPPPSNSATMSLPQMGQQRAPVADHFQLNGYLDSGPTPPPAHVPSHAHAHASPGSLSAVSGDSFIHSTLSSYFLGSSDLTNNLNLDLPAAAAAPIRHPMLSWLCIITRSLILPQIDIFYARLHPILPLIPRSYIQAGIDSSRHLQDPSFAALLLVMTSLALVGPVSASDSRSNSRHPHSRSNPHSTIAEKQEMAVHLLQEAMRVKGLSSATEFEPTLDAIWTSFLLFAARFNLEQHHEAWYRLREALTLAETMELHKQSAYEGISAEDCSSRIRTLWVLLVTERAYAMQKNHSITFTTSRVSWSLSDMPPQLASSAALDQPPLLGVRCLAHLYSFIDEEIISCWNGKCLEGVCRTLDVEQVIVLQRGLGGWAEGITDARLSQLSEANRFDLLLSQQWLRNRIWQLTVSHCLSSTDASDVELQPSYSLLIAKETVRVCRSFEREALEANGVGVAHKLHDIVLSVIYANRILYDSPPEPWMSGASPRVVGAQLRHELTGLLRAFRGGEHPFLTPVEEMP